MIRTTFSSLCFTSVLISSTLADEYTVSEKPFEKSTTLNGVFLPSQSTALSIAPKVWKDFSITSLVNQGALVKKGDTLIGIDTTKIDEQIAKATKSLEISHLNLCLLYTSPSPRD